MELAATQTPDAEPVDPNALGRQVHQAPSDQSQAMETVGQLAGGVAHEFNNLLTVILGNLNTVDMPPDDPNREFIVTATRAAAQAAELTRQLLGFARRSPMHLAPVAVHRLVAESVDSLRRTLDNRVVIRTDIPPRLVASADAALLRQAVMSLMFNARDALPGGGTITLSAVERTVESDPFICLSVADSGPGIAPEVRDRVFEPFVTTKPVGQGTGLGLAMVHGIARQHGGWVECHSGPGTGTRFDLYLPAAVESLPAPPPPPSMARMPLPAKFGAGRTILVVDDEPMIRVLARHTLTRAGFRVVEAGNGHEAIACFSQETDVAVVILDVVMPVADGRIAYDGIRRLDPTARIVLSSGYTNADRIDLPSPARMLAKPWRPAELIEAVSSALK